MVEWFEVSNVAFVSPHIYPVWCRQVRARTAPARMGTSRKTNPTETQAQMMENTRRREKETSKPSNDDGRGKREETTLRTQGQSGHEHTHGDAKERKWEREHDACNAGASTLLNTRACANGAPSFDVQGSRAPPGAPRASRLNVDDADTGEHGNGHGNVNRNGQRLR